ncbi:MAG: V-type ATP synthase subunit E [bacterium]
MLLEKVFETLDIEAGVVRDDLIDKAKKEAQRIIKEAEDEAHAVKMFHIGKMEQKLKGDAARIQIETDLHHKRIITKAKEEVTNKIYFEVTKRLKDVCNNQETYKKVFMNLLVESLDAVKGNKIKIEVNQKDKELACSSLKELNLNHEITAGRDYLGGLTLGVDGNRIFVSNTIESRLLKSREFLKTQLNEVLFNEG